MSYQYYPVNISPFDFDNAGRQRHYTIHRNQYESTGRLFISQKN